MKDTHVYWFAAERRHLGNEGIQYTATAIDATGETVFEMETACHTTMLSLHLERIRRICAEEGSKPVRIVLDMAL